ncbi:MAG: FHA domain-containing protein [Planctomycetales bacterium]|nr:FHA domain-containing protein [Planctomycetales bacterium]
MPRSAPPDPPRATLREYAESAGRLDRRKFAATHPLPVLVALGGSGALLEAFGYETVVPGQTPGGASAGCRVQPEATVWVVRKRLPALPDRISIGRTPNTDIVIPDAGISKLHAYLTWGAKPRELTVEDANSRNGTFVNEKRLAPLEPSRIRDGEILQLGRNVRAVLLFPEALWRVARAAKG